MRLYGLVLVGGHSTRMGTDKAQLLINDLKLYQLAEKNLKTVCDKVFLSIQSDQKDIYVGHDLILNSETYNDIGAVHGLLSAYEAYPDVTWLIFACDFPVATAHAIKQLVNNDRLSTTCCIHSDNQPDPFFAVWSPEALEQLKQNVILKGKNGPCSALMQSIGLGGTYKLASICSRSLITFVQMTQNGSSIQM